MGGKSLGGVGVADVWLSKTVRVKHYLAMEAKEDRAGIAEFLYERFMERYVRSLKPLSDEHGNGFIVAGACCLMIEGLMAFRNGWKSTKGKSKEALTLFIQGSPKFSALAGDEKDFWLGVRCGILHQGESSRGWRLSFSNAGVGLIEMPGKRLNCSKFLAAVEQALQEFRHDLEAEPWTGGLWQNVRSKMAATIEDCKR